MLAHILGSGSNSRLYRALVVDKRVAVSAGAWYDSAALDMSKFGVYRRAAPGRHAAAARSRCRRGDRRGDRARASSAEELERAKTRLIADAVYAQDNQVSMARWYGTALTTGAHRRRRAALAGPHPRRHRRARCRTPPASGSTSGARSPAILIKDASPQAEKKS